MKKSLHKKRKIIIKKEIKEKDPVYIKLEYDESVQSKKELLLLELSLLTLLKEIKRYSSLRLEELSMKSSLYKTIRELSISMKKTMSTFPFLKIPEQAKRNEIIRKEKPKEIIQTKEIFDEDLESQLKSIQDRLKTIGA